MYYVDLDESRRLTLMRVPTHGGIPEEIAVREWNYGARTGVLDPMGVGIRPGPDAWFELMRRLANSLHDCLAAP